MEASQSKENLAYKMGDQSTSKINLVLIIIALVIAVIALIIACVGMSQKGNLNVNVSTSPGEGGTSAGQTGEGLGSGFSEDTRIWTFAIGDGEYREAYVDQRTGTLRGFLVDLVNAVCKVAEKNCRVMGDIWTRCWDTKPGEAARGGEGLMGGWYDGCPGWVGTFDRHRTYLFTDPYGKGDIEKLFVKKGAGATFGKDLTGKKVGILDGWSTDEHCLARQTVLSGVPLTTDRFIHFQNPSDVIAAINNDEVDVAFAPVTVFSTDDLDLVPNLDLSCVSSGPGVMTRVDSELSIWWNPALKRLISTPAYETVCQDLVDEHGHQEGREPADLCFLD